MPGIFVLGGMGLRIPAGGLVISTGPDGAPKMEVTKTLVRFDLWTTWLEIGCAHAEVAWEAGRRLAPDLQDQDKYSALADELQAGIVAVTAFAFAFDGFYDTVRHELGPHPHEAIWKGKRTRRTGRDAQVVETLRYHLKLGPVFTRQLRTTVRELFKFRSRAVHPSSEFVEPNFRPEIDSGVHPYLITFSGPHAVQCRALALELFGRFVERAAERAAPGSDVGWLERGRSEVGRMSARYRIAGDEQPAFQPPT